MKTFKILAICTLLALSALPSAANADDRRGNDRHFDHDDRRHHDRYDRGFEHNYRENERFWNRSYNRGRGYGDNHGYGYGNHGYGHNYGHSSNVIIVGRPRSYNYGSSYSSYSPYNGSSTVIYGDGNLVPLGNGGSYFSGR